MAGKSRSDLITFVVHSISGTWDPVRQGNYMESVPCVYTLTLETSSEVKRLGKRAR